MPLPPNRFWPGCTLYTGAEYKEVLRKRYGLPEDWEPEPPAAKKWRRSDFLSQNPEFIKMMEENGHLEPEDFANDRQED
jgi:hypothetical protein